MTQTTARDFMMKKLVTLRPEMDVIDAVQRLLKNRISGAPVVDDGGRFVGVFSEKCAMQVLLDAAYEQLPSNEIRLFMDTNAQTIEPDTQLLSIAQVFLLTPYRRLPVLQDGILIGQVSRRDVMQASLELLKRPVLHEEGSSLLYLS
ncbi:MAG: CBS domain-containing protein, partial [Bythopirellula sp.]